MFLLVSTIFQTQIGMEFQIGGWGLGIRDWRLGIGEVLSLSPLLSLIPRSLMLKLGWESPNEGTRGSDRTRLLLFADNQLQLYRNQEKAGDRQ
jgi:hypothetical protein